MSFPDDVEFSFHIVWSGEGKEYGNVDIFGAGSLGHERIDGLAEICESCALKSVAEAL